MTKFYSPDGSDLRPAKLPKSTITDIGRLIRAFAEIEELVTLHLCQVAAIDESVATVLVGRASISSRINMAEAICKTVDQAAIDRHLQTVGGDFTECLTCRNAMAHGYLLGRSHGNQYAFLTDQ